MKKTLNRIQNRLRWWLKRKWENTWLILLRFDWRMLLSMGFFLLWEWVRALISILLIITYLFWKTCLKTLKTKMKIFQKKMQSKMNFTTQNWKQMKKSTCHCISWEKSWWMKLLWKIFKKSKIILIGLMKGLKKWMKSEKG